MSDTANTSTIPTRAADSGSAPPPPIEVKQDEEYVYFEFGKEEVAVPPLSFYALKKCWDDIVRAASTASVIERIGAVLTTVESALGDTDHPMTVDDLSKKLTAKGWPHLTAAYGQLLVKSGLMEAS